MRRRVVVTGMGGLCPLGASWPEISLALRKGLSGVALCPELAEYEGMETRLAARVQGFEVPAHYPRKSTRSMGRVALLATRASELALQDAGLLGSALLGDGTTGISYGSTAGSPPAMAVYANTLFGKRTLRGIRAVDYVQFMSHTVPANLAQFFGVRGRIVSTCSACTSGAQGIGYGYETIVAGKHDVMISGGADEYHAIDSAVFDILFATSRRREEPLRSPRPFDIERDGLVVAEGAATLVLEELEHARRRGAPIYAELAGYATNCDGQHITNPDAAGMQRVMQLALADAGLAPEAIDYVSAHGTATELGDIAETQATHAVYGPRVPISSLKGNMGHTLGACGALEAWLTIEMLREGWFAPTLNLDQVDPRCGALDYNRGAPRELAARCFASNNFAFGGVNTSLIFRAYSH
jgi:3-oxoacyl-[acyl-carrier-protein] synthase II